MPNQPRADNPAHAIRIEDEDWSAVEALARQDGVSSSAVVRERLVRRYVAQRGQRERKP